MKEYVKQYLKELLKNPALYYIAAPVMAAVWALLAGVVFYPGSVQNWEDTVKPEYENSQEWIEKLIVLEPQRLQYKALGTGAGKFDFNETVNTLTQLFGILPSNFTLNINPEVPRGGKKARTAAMTIKEIDIETAARFLSAMLTAWPDLNCEVFGLEKAKVGKNRWAVDIKLTYYY